MLELNVPNGRSVFGGFAAEIQPNVDKLIADKAVRAVLVDRRRALDRDSGQAGLDRHELQTLSRCPGVVKLISVAARSDEISAACCGRHQDNPAGAIVRIVDRSPINAASHQGEPHGRSNSRLLTLSDSVGTWKAWLLPMQMENGWTV